MKKLIIIFLIMSFSFYINAKIEILQNAKNQKYLKGAKPVYILLTFEGTKLFGDPMDKYIANVRKKGIKLTRQQLIEDYTDNVRKSIKRWGKKWDMKLITSQSQVRGGFLFIVNLQYVTPIPGVGYNCGAVVSVYKAGKLIIKFYSKPFIMTSAWLPRFSFPLSGVSIMEEVCIFLRKSNRL